MRPLIFLATLLIFTHCGTTPTIPAPDLKIPAIDMATAAQPDLSPVPALVSVSPQTATIGGDTTITVKGSACHFDTWCGIGSATSFTSCVLSSFTTKIVDADTVQFTLSVPMGAQPMACGISIQPRLQNSGGGCGANAGPLLQLSPAFSLK